MASLIEKGFGITATGFNKPNISDLMTRLEEIYQETESFGSDFSFKTDKVLYQFASAPTRLVGEQLEILEQMYNNATPLKAGGAQLYKFGSFIGKSLKQASAAEVDLLLTAANGTQIPDNYQVKTVDGIVFKVVSGGTVTTGSITLKSVAEVKGSSGNVGANTITHVVSPLAGLTSVTNPLAATKGQDAETETQFREGYFATLDEAGGLNVDGIAAKLKELAGVTGAVVYENTTMAEVDGVPAKSIAPYAIGGSDNDIAYQLLVSKPGGIQSFGTVVVAVTDSQGIEHQIGFSRPTDVNVWSRITITKNAQYPPTADALIKQATIDHINSVGLGKNVYPYQISSAISGMNISGIENIVVELSTNGTVWSPNHIAITRTQVAVTDDGKVTVIS